MYSLALGVLLLIFSIELGMKNNEGQVASKDDSYFRVVSIKLDLNHHNHLVFAFSFRIKDDDTFNKI